MPAVVAGSDEPCSGDGDYNKNNASGGVAILARSWLGLAKADGGSMVVQARVVAAEQDHAHALGGVEAARRTAAASSERRLAALKLLEVARISGERRLALQRWRLVTAVLAMSTSEASALGARQWADPEPNPRP